MVDASVALSWFFADERSEAARHSAERLLEESAVVPSIFPAEVANALLSASKKRRIDDRGVATALGHLAGLPIRVETCGFALDEEMRLAKRYGLTVYDAMYLALARRRNLALWTHDGALRRAAAAEHLADRS